MRRYTRWIATALLSLTCLSGVAVGDDRAAVEKKLIQMEKDWTKASLAGDSAALSQILADDWVGQGTWGTFTKAQVLADLKSGDNKLSSITLADMKVRVFGDTAVVTSSDDEKSSYKGKDTSGHYVWTDVFVKRKGKWQAVASHGTLVPPK